MDDKKSSQPSRPNGSVQNQKTCLLLILGKKGTDARRSILNVVYGRVHLSVPAYLGAALQAIEDAKQTGQLDDVTHQTASMRLIFAAILRKLRATSNLARP